MLQQSLRHMARQPSKAVLWALLPLLFASSLWLFPIRQPEGVGGCITWDTQGYLLYLTGTLHGDLTQHAYAAGNPYTPYYLHAQPNGNRIIQYWMGFAVLMAPGFAVAHGMALLTDYPADGFSAPYHWAVYLSCWLYFALALWVTRAVLLRYFSERVTAATLLLLLLGTNLLFLSQAGITQVHLPLLFPVAVLAWAMPRWYAQPTRSRSLSIGLLLGFIMLVRPTEGLLLLVVPLFGLGQPGQGLRQHWQLLWQRRVALLLVLAGLLLALLPQIGYWLAVAGKPLVHSYGAHNTFHWKAPHILDGLFSYRKGWLFYTPLMALALVGLWPLRKTGWSWAIAIYLALNIYVVFCWHMWWYTFGVGMRALVQAYPLLALGLAALLAQAAQVRWRRWLLGALVVPMVVLNGFQLWQYYHFILPKDGMTRLLYHATFGRTQPDYRLAKYQDLAQARADAPNGPLLAQYAHQQGEALSPQREFSTTLKVGLRQLRAGDWLRVLAVTRYDVDDFTPEAQSMLVCQLKGPQAPLLWVGVRLQHATHKGHTDSLWYEVQLPQGVSAQDSLHLYMWNPCCSLRLYKLSAWQLP
jgi:hypothetical protein